MLRAATLTIVAAALPIAASSPSARGQGNCQWYATTALKQQQDNERLKCGFTGPTWSSDIRAHMAWCASVPPEAWRSVAQKRDQDLAKCAAQAR